MKALLTLDREYRTGKKKSDILRNVNQKHFQMWSQQHETETRESFQARPDLVYFGWGRHANKKQKQKMYAWEREREKGC